MADKNLKVAVRYGENFNPFEHLSNAQKEDGTPAFEPYVLNGVPQTGEGPDGNVRLLKVPMYNIDGNSMRDWWWTAFPEGRIETLRTTPDAVYDQEKHKFVYADEIFEVRLYKHSGDEKPFANGFGKAPVVEGGKFPELPSAVTLAFKNAMANAGFGVDLDWDKIRENAPNFFEIEMGEDPSKFVPVVKAAFSEKSSPAVQINAVRESHETGVPILPGQMMIGVEKKESASVTAGNNLDFSSPIFKAMAKKQEETDSVDTSAEDAKEQQAGNAKLEELLSTVFVSYNKTAFERYSGKTFKENLEDYPEDFGGVLERISRARSQYVRNIPVEVLDAIEDYLAMTEDGEATPENYQAM